MVRGVNPLPPLFIHFFFIIFTSMNERLKRIIINHLNKEYSGLVRYETDRWNNTIFFIKDGKIIFEYIKRNGDVYISYNKIWFFLESVFGLEFNEISNITKLWVEEHYKLRVKTSYNNYFGIFKEVEEHYRLTNPAHPLIYHMVRCV